MKQRLKIVMTILNSLRGGVLYLLSENNPKINLDFERWTSICSRAMPGLKSRFMRFNYLMLYYRAFRSVVLSRLKEESYIRFVMGRLLYKPVTNLYINSEKIDGGLLLNMDFRLS